MGVRGLTSFCASMEAHISDKVELEVGEAGSPRGTAFVIDAYAFLFASFYAHFGDSLYGGQYAAFVQATIDCINAWRSAGLNPIFVFDGVAPTSKSNTVTARIAQKAAHLSLYMRSSAPSRTSIKWQTSSGFVPPLLNRALLEAAQQTDAEIVMAPEEADPVIVALAGKLGGYAVSKDSDMFIFSPPGSGYKGYVPIDSIAYICRKSADESTSAPVSSSQDVDAGLSTESAAADTAPVRNDGDDGFTAVVSGRRGRRARVAPPTAPSTPSKNPALKFDSSAPTVLTHPPTTAAQTLQAITFSAYLPSKLAAHLDLPLPLLPILGAILGNDHSHPAHYRILFPRDVGSVIQKVQLCVRSLREEWAGERSPARSTSTSRAPSVPGSPNPWRKLNPALSASGSPARLGSGRGTPTSPSRTPNSSSGAGLDASFVSIRSIGSNGYTTASGFSTPRARGSEWGGETESGHHPDNDDDDGASLVSDAPPLDPVRSLIISVIRRIALGVTGTGTTPAPAPTALPAGRNRRAGWGKMAEGEGTPEWNEVVDAILEGTRSYALQMQVDPDELGKPDTSRFTAHLQRSEGGGGTLLLDDDVDVGEGGKRGERLKVMQRYADAFTNSRFSGGLPEIMASRVFAPWFCLEDPDMRTTAVGAPREIRQWVYAILFGAYGLEWARDTLDASESDEDAEEDDEDASDAGLTAVKPVRGGLTSSWIIPKTAEPDEDPDELILVQTPPSVSSFNDDEDNGEEDDDADVEDDGTGRAGPRRGGLQDALSLREKARESLDQEEKVKPAPVVVEMIRRGERAVLEEVPIPSLADLLRERQRENNINNSAEPFFKDLSVFADASIASTTAGRKPTLPPHQLVLSTDQVRTSALFHILRANVNIAKLDSDLQLLALSLRFLVLSEAERWGVSAPKHNWRREEMEAAVYAGCLGLRLWRGRGKGASSSSVASEVGQKMQWAYHSLYPDFVAGGSVNTTEPSPTPTPAAPEVRAIHLSSSLQATLQAAHTLTQVLLLDTPPPAPPHAMHEGPLFHAYLTSHSSSDLFWTDAELDQARKEVMHAVLAGVDEGQLGRDLEEERREKRRRQKAAAAATAAAAAVETTTKKDAGGGKVNEKAGIANLYAALSIE
ncbi:unnamed protein product [Tilletia controversa]|nr:unnamed protein product [Tilletia controversa]